MIKAIIYDCVGPLLVSNPKVKQFDNTTNKIDQLCGETTNESKFWMNIKEKYGLDDKKLKKIIKEIANQRMLNALMWKFHKKTKNKYKTAIINNGTLTIFNIWSKKYHFDKNFDSLFNSAEEGLIKPDPKIFKLACKSLGVQLNEAILIDDTKKNITGAKKIGMKAVWYNQTKHQNFLIKIEKLLSK